MLLLIHPKLGMLKIARKVYRLVVVVECICSAHIVPDNHVDACARPQNKCCVGKSILKRLSDGPLVEVVSFQPRLKRSQGITFTIIIICDLG